MKPRAIILCLVLLMMLSLPALNAAGSWVQINQPITRPEGWQRFVKESPFTLGDKAPYAQDSPLTLQQWGNYPSIDGSTVCVPLGMELARQHLSVPEADLAGFVNFSTTHSAYERLILGRPNPNVSLASCQTVLDPEKPVDLILVTAPSDEERALAREQGVELVLAPFCYDAFVFLVNAENPVDSLTAQQIRDIYAGRILDWGLVGGTAGLPLEAFQRPRNSGSQTAMEQLVMRGQTMFAAQDNYISDGMGDLVRQVGNFDSGQRALGYSYLYYVTGLYKSGGIKVLSVDGISPARENLVSGLYPFTVSYYAVYLKGNQTAERFVEWLQGSEGQQAVRQAGYIPLVEVEETP